MTVDGTEVTTGFTVAENKVKFTTAPASTKVIKVTYHYVG